MVDVPNTTADNMANDLFANLTEGKDFTLPALDLSDVSFVTPVSTDNPVYADVTPLNEGSLTSREVGGTGLFDGIMKAVSAHVQEEYDDGRITGKEYSNAYVALTQAALATSVQFLLGKEQAYWSAMLAQKQSQAAEIEVVNTRLSLEASKAATIKQRADAENSAAIYALTKLQLAVEESKHGLTQAQTTQTEYETTTLLPANLGFTQAQTSKIDYEVTYVLPKEVDRIVNQIAIGTAQEGHTVAQKDQVLYTTASLLPSQKLVTDAEKAIKDYQLATFLPAQVAGITVETAGKTYTNDNILPAQRDLALENVETARAKTMDTRTDGVTSIEGSIGKSKDLQQQQIESYQHDAEAKVAKMLLDTWVTQKSIDEGLVPPTSLSDADINTVLTSIRTNLSLV
jgi:hypothetical protein